MAAIELTDAERKVLSYCYRGANKNTAEQRMAEFFKMDALEVRAVLGKLVRNGIIIESNGIAGVSVYTASPLKVRSAMIDQRVVEQLKAAEAGGKAAGFKKRTFDPDTGAVSTRPLKPGAVTNTPGKKQVDLGFDIE